MKLKKCRKYLIYNDISSATQTTKNSFIRHCFCLADELADDWRMVADENTKVNEINEIHNFTSGG